VLSRSRIASLGFHVFPKNFLTFLKMAGFVIFHSKKKVH